jgi:hypothetical protein
MIIEAKTKGGRQQVNITGGRLRTKFSIHQKSDGYFATAAFGNSELIQLLEGLTELGGKKGNDNKYHWWEVAPNKLISVINAVICEFE